MWGGRGAPEAPESGGQCGHGCSKHLRTPVFLASSTRRAAPGPSPQYFARASSGGCERDRKILAVDRRAARQVDAAAALGMWQRSAVFPLWDGEDEAAQAMEAEKGKVLLRPKEVRGGGVGRGPTRGTLGRGGDSR